MHKGQGGGGRAGGGVMGMSEACMERVGESAEEALTEARRSDVGGGCSPGTLPAASAMALNLCFLVCKPGRNSLP